MLILSVLVYRKHLLKEMIERLTVHLQKKRKNTKKQVSENLKLILLIKAIPNLRLFMSLIKTLFLHQIVLINVL